MARTGGEITRKKILETAENLFAEKGYDGASIQDIASEANVNKALIYYHFKNKQHIIDSLFEQTLDEMFSMHADSLEQPEKSQHAGTVDQRLNGIISILGKKKKILSVMLMEALREDKDGYISLFQCANMIISRNVSQMMHELNQKKVNVSREELLVHEFFTGFVPIVFFAIFKDKWAEFFKCDRQAILQTFIKVFAESHIGHS